MRSLHPRALSGPLFGGAALLFGLSLFSGCSVLSGASLVETRLTPAPQGQKAAPSGAAPAGAPAAGDPAAVAAPASAPAGKPADPGSEALPPVEDNGFTTDVHRERAGEIVFAKTAEAVTTPEKPASFADSFAASDTIYFRAYLPHSLQNAFRAEGVDCSEPWRVYSAAIDGKVVASGSDPYFYWESLDERGYSKSTSIRYDKPLNGKGQSDEKSIWRAFGERVAPNLTPGSHAITLSVSGKCSAKNRSGLPDVYLSKPMATGEFKLEVSAKDAEKLAAGAGLPKPGMKSQKLEKEMAEIMAGQWAPDQILKVVIVDGKWAVQKTSRGLTLSRTIGAAVAVKQPAGQCRLFEVSFIQKAEGQDKFGQTEYNSVGTSSEIPCAAIK